MRSILLAATLLCACGSTPSAPTAASDAGADDAPVGPLTIALGEGLTRYTPLPADGGAIELVLGPQGGWHLDLAARVSGASPEGLTLEYAVRTAAGATIHVPTRVSLNARRVLADGDGFVRVGDRAVLDVRDGNALVDAVVELSVLAADARGRSARDARLARVVDRVR